MSEARQMEEVISGQCGQHNTLFVYIIWHYIFGFLWNVDICYTIVSRHIMWEKSLNNQKPNHYYLNYPRLSKISKTQNKTKQPRVICKILANVYACNISTNGISEGLLSNYKNGKVYCEIMTRRKVLSLWLSSYGVWNAETKAKRQVSL